MNDTYINQFRKMNPEYRNVEPDRLVDIIYQNHPTVKSKYTRDEFAEVAGANAEIRQRNQQEMGDFSRGLHAGVNQLQGSVQGAIGMAGSFADKAGIPGGEAVRDWGLEKYQQNMNEASLYPTPSLKDVGKAEGILGKAGTAIDWAQGTIGQLAPSMAEAAAGAVIGSLVAPGPGTAAGGLAGRTILRKSIDEVTDKMIEGYIKRGVIKHEAAAELRDQVRQQATRKALKKLGGKAGMGAAVFPMEAGGNYGEVMAEHGVDAPATAALTGSLATGLEFFGGNSRLVDTFVDAIVRGAPKAVKQSAREILRNIPEEMAQEAGQETLSILNTVVNTDEEMLTAENIERIVESGAAGALGGGFGAGGRAIMSGVFGKDGRQAIGNKTRQAIDLLKKPGGETDGAVDGRTDLLGDLEQQVEQAVPGGGDDGEGVAQPPSSGAAPLSSSSAPAAAGFDELENWVRSLPDDNLMVQVRSSAKKLEQAPNNEELQVINAAATDEAGRRGLDIGQTPTPAVNAAPAQGPETAVVPPSEGGDRAISGAPGSQFSGVLTENSDLSTPAGRQAIADPFDDAMAVNARANEAATSPTNETPPSEKQIEAGNYKKGHVKIAGLDISIENPAGSVRSGTAEDGTEWETRLNHHYGYIKGTQGRDKDHIDVFVNPDNPVADRVFVVDQVDPATGRFDEHKVVMGFDSADAARQAYLSNYEEGWAGLGDITEMPMEDFKQWANTGKRKTRPVGDISGVAVRPERRTGEDRRENAALRETIAGLPGDMQEKIQRIFRKEVETASEQDEFVPGVLNKRGMLRRVPSPTTEVPMLSMDLDKFKWINDNSVQATTKEGDVIQGGHPIGDYILKSFGELMTEAREEAGAPALNVARAGGDEFQAFGDPANPGAVTPDLLDNYQKILENKAREFTFEVEDADGNRFVLDGLPVSIGRGNSMADAEMRLKEVKDEKVRTGERSPERDARPATLRPAEQREGGPEQPEIVQGVPEGPAAGGVDTGTGPARKEVAPPAKPTQKSRTKREKALDEYHQYINSLSDEQRKAVSHLIEESPQYPSGQKTKIVAALKKTEPARAEPAAEKDATETPEPPATEEKAGAVDEAPDGVQADDILTQQGRPFASKGAAMFARKNKKLMDTHDVTQVGDKQWVVRKRPTETESPGYADEMKQRADEQYAGWKGRPKAGDTAYLPDNTPVAFEYAVVEADQPMASHNADMSVNPDFPETLQPRDRGRDAMKVQVMDIAQKLNPDRLGKDASVSRGAPVVGPDGVVESGNGRTLAIRQAYRSGNGDGYKRWLVDNAASFGVDAADVRRMKKPMLVRQRTSSVSDRNQFVRKANEEDVATMSPLEQAESDAMMLDKRDMAIFAPSEEGDISAASNRRFVERFLNKLGPAARAEYVMADGGFTRQLLDRVEAAVFHKAYGSAALTELVAESPDPEVRNILKAMLTAAGKFTKAGAIDPGMGNTSLVQQITGAVEYIRLAKREEPNMAVKKAVKNRRQQTDLFTAEPEPGTGMLLDFFVENVRSAKRMGGMLGELAESLRKFLDDLAYGDNLITGPSSFNTEEEISDATKKYTKEESAEGDGLLEFAGRDNQGDTKSQPDGDERTGAGDTGIGEAGGEEKAGKIEDFGEVLEGARKHYVDKLADASALDTEKHPLSKTWPEPDYQQMIADGADPKVVALIRAMRDQVPARGRQSWKVRRYVEAVEGLREFAQRILSGEYSYDDVVSRFEEKGGLKSVLDARDLYLAVGHDHSLKNVRIGAGRYSVYKGKEYKPAKTIYTVETTPRKTVGSNFPRELASGDTREEAIENFKKNAAEILPNLNRKAKQTRFSIYSKRGEPGVYIGKRYTANRYVDLEKFDTAKAARAYLAKNQEALEKKLEKARNFPSERKVENAPRVGVDHLDGRDATPDMFMEAFGFRGVQFGNYVEQSKRQEDLNETYNGLMDMAGVLGIPAKAVSLNGELGLAFGARGKGGKKAPKAHYEPDAVVINLTKKEGAGSLAHEWWHALDGYFDRQRNIHKEPGHLTERPGAAAGDQIRPAVLQAFNGVMDAIRKTGLPQRSMKQDRTRSKPYWTRGTEMSARAFENYIIEKLHDQNGANDYLANVVDQEVWDAAAAMGFEQEGSYPYLTKEEIPDVKRAFQHLFDTIESRETEKGVMLFQRGGKQAKPGMSREDVAAVVNDRVGRAGRLPGMNVVQSEADLPGRVRNMIRQKNAEGEVTAVFDRGEVWFVADNIRSEAAAESAVLHEVFGHYGVESLFTRDQAVQFFNRVHLSRAKTPEYRAVMNDYDLDPGKREDRITAAREYIARQAEAGVDDSWVTKLIGMVRDALRKMGFKLQISDNDIRRLIALGARQMQEGGGHLLVADTTGFSKIAAKWYSEMERTLADKLPEKGTGKSYAQTIQAWAEKGQADPQHPLKKEELEWSGLIDWLEGQEKVTKGEVLDWLAENNVRVEEVVKLQDSTSDGIIKSIDNWQDYLLDDVEKSEISEIENDFVDENTNELILVDEVGEDFTSNFLNLYGESFTDEFQERIRFSNMGVGFEAPRLDTTKFSEYQTPGGENYKELLITLPRRKTKMPDDIIINREDSGLFEESELFVATRRGEVVASGYNLSDVENRILQLDNEDTDYTSSHWSEPNVLAHVRFNERTGPNGERVLFLEEVQSDWHQAGRKKGYRGSPPSDTQVREFFGLAEDVNPADYRQEMMEHHSYKPTPDAPFKKNWPLLAMKRIVRYAAENGFDTVAWTPGEVQAERYDLSKQVDAIYYDKNKDGTYSLSVVKDGSTVRDDSGRLKEIPESKLEEYVGKDVAQKIVDGEGELLSDLGFEDYSDPNNVKPATGKKLSGLDLKVGGEGMKGFYDKILPTAVNKFFGKAKWGKARVGEMEIEDRFFVPNEFDEGGVGVEGEGFEEVEKITAHALAITPEMRDKALTEGMPLFQIMGEQRTEPGRGEPLFQLTGRKDSATNKAMSTEKGKGDITTEETPDGPGGIDLSGEDIPISDSYNIDKWGKWEYSQPDRITPTNPPWNAEKTRNLTEKFKQSGWSGPPILVIADTDGTGVSMQAATGSHRLAAASDEYAAGVPVVKIWAEDGFDTNEFNNIEDDIDRFEYLKKIGQEDALPLMAREVVANQEADIKALDAFFEDYPLLQSEFPVLYKRVKDIVSGATKIGSVKEVYALPNPTSPAGEPGNDPMFQRVKNADTAIPEESVGTAKRMLEYVKGREGDFSLSKPDIGLLERTVGLMSHFSKKVPGLKRMFEAGLEWSDDKFHNQNTLFHNDKDVSYLKIIKNFKKRDKAGYDRLRDYLLERDANAQGYRVVREDEFKIEDQWVPAMEMEKQGVDPAKLKVGKKTALGTVEMIRPGEEYRLYDPAGEFVKAYEDERVAWNDAVIREARDYGGTRDETNALIAFRQIAHNIFDMRYQAISDLIDRYAEEGTTPEIAFRDENGEEVKIDLKVALAEMGDLRGHYFPRIRNQGQWVIRATKPGENPILEMRDNRIFATRRRKALEAEGYTVAPITKSEKMPESVFALAGQTIAINELVDKALEGVNSPRLKTLKEIGFTGNWDGDDFILHGVVNRPDHQDIIESLGGEYEKRVTTGMRSIRKEGFYRFKDADKTIEDKLKELLFLSRGFASADMELLFAHEFAQQIGNTIKQRGARSALIQRKQVRGKDVWKGYEEDPLTAITRSGASTASAMAKKAMAVKMIRAIQGTNESWQEYRDRVKAEGGEPAYQDYKAQVAAEKISADKQKNAFEIATRYMQDMLRNDEAIDRTMGTIKGLAVLKYLGFRVAAPAVNLTAMFTNVPATMNAYAGIPIHKAGVHIAEATNAYVRYLRRPKMMNQWTRAALDEIHDKGWHASQFNMEAANILKSKAGVAWGKLIDYSMWMFGKTEQFNRVASILGAYEGIRKAHEGEWTQADHEKAIETAKEVSDKAHGTYGKVNYPDIARGSNMGAQIIRSAYVFKTFSHNYLLTLKEIGFDEKNLKAAAWMTLSPAILSGAMASLPVGLAMGIIKAFDLGDMDDPEEELYRWMASNAGDMGRRFTEQGAFGLLGINMKGSLKINMTEVPTTIPEVLGAPGSVMQDFYYGFGNLFKGNYWRAAEDLLPNAGASVMKGFREYSEGVTTHRYTPVFYGREQLKASPLDAALRFLSFNPGRLSSIKSKQWREKNIEREYRNRRADINSQIKKYFMQPPNERTVDDWADIVADIQEYNIRIKRNGLDGIMGYIDPGDIRSLIKRTFKPSKKEVAKRAAGY